MEHNGMARCRDILLNRHDPVDYKQNTDILSPCTRRARLLGSNHVAKAVMLKSVARIAIGAPLLLLLPLVSLVFFILLSPLLLVSLFLKSREPRGDAERLERNDAGLDLEFNRTHDISKLTGCNTRSVQYRWGIFSDLIHGVDAKDDRKALDFGSGSLRDTWELAQHGFRVTALDVDDTQMERARGLYDWGQVHHEPEYTTKGLASVAKDHFDLIVAFDVLEHVIELPQVLPQIFDRLKPGGYMLVSVPNGRTLRERTGKVMQGLRRLAGRGDSRPGLHHVNFKTPAGWTRYFEDHGFTVMRHEMAIGHLVNDWHWIHAFPLGVSGVARRHPNLERSFCPPALMKRLDLVDPFLRPVTQGLWGWNLFVLTRS
jgi:2-polyprenyl-3-methyl-5-hydroxy-6-metoxy-1,4-benzoquinol methylase